MEEIDGRLSVIRNDLALGLFDRKELDMLVGLLDVFDGYVTAHRKEKKMLVGSGLDFDEIFRKMEEDNE